MRVQHSDVVIGAGAGVVVTITKHGTPTPAVLWAAQTGEEVLQAVLTNEFGYYSVWLDEGEYDESVAASPREDRVLSILSWQSLQAASEVKEGPPGEKGEKGEKGATGEPGAAVGGYQTGDLRFTALPALAAGWLACDGSAVSRVGETKALFEAIGTAYGAGDGSTTFNLPDFRGRSPIGLGKGTAGDEGEVFPTLTLGQKVGRYVHKLTTAQLAKHTHTATDAGHKHKPESGPATFKVGGIGGTYADVNASPVYPNTYQLADNNETASAKANVTNSEAGGGETHPNVHPASVCAIWIKK